MNRLNQNSAPTHRNQAIGTEDLHAADRIKRGRMKYRNFDKKATQHTRNLEIQNKGVAKTSLIQSLVMSILLVFSGALSAMAQQTDITNAFTPDGMEPGSPAGSYAISGFENVNLANGNLNVNLPLLSIGGRGNSGYKMILPLEFRWEVVTQRIPFRVDSTFASAGFPGLSSWTTTEDKYLPVAKAFDPDIGYGPGRFKMQRASKFPEFCAPPGGPGNNPVGNVLSRGVFIAPGGTQIEFYDKATGGDPLLLACNTPEAERNRGKIWIARDGSGTQFIFNDDFIERPEPATDTSVYPTGEIVFPNGKRYKVVQGNVTEIIDINGNKTTFTYDLDRITSITDSLNRVTTISYGTGLPSTDTITFGGLGGQARTIKVVKDSQSNLLHSGYSMTSTLALFPTLPDAQTGTQDPTQIAYVELPDGRKYNFKYNSHGDISRIETPTGAAIEYEWDGYANGPGIWRWVKNRRTYPNGGTGSSYELKTVYKFSPKSFNNPTPGTETTVTDYGSSNQVLRSSKLFRDTTLESTGMFSWRSGDKMQPIETQNFGTDGRWLSRSLTSWIKKEPTKRDARVSKTVTILFEEGQNIALATLSTTEYDENGIADPAYFSHLNPKSSKSYKYKALDLTTAQTGDLATIAALFTSTDLAAVTETDYSYDASYFARGITSLPTETRVLNPDNLSDVLGKTQTKFDETAYPIMDSGSTTGWTDPGSNLRGNATTNRTWVKETNTWIETHAQYDNFGNVRKTHDAKGNIAETEYSATYKFAYPTKSKSAIPDPSGTSGSSTAFETETTYDLNTGLVLTATDANGNTSTTEYNDLLLRPTAVVAPNGARTEMEYGDTPGNIFVKTRSEFDTGVWVESTAFADNLGRGIKTHKKDVNGDIFTETEYDALSRVTRVTNPYRLGDTKLYSITTYDEEGRVDETFSPAPNGQQGDSLGTSEYGFINEAGLVGTYVVGIDASGRKGRSITNSLGQLARVDEATDFGGTITNDLGTLASPNQATSYEYDVFGKMVKVTQGVQTRHFHYDALGRLIRVRQPEQEVNTALNLAGPHNSNWTAAFEYDDNGNLVKTTDAKGVIITNTYDNLNRVKSRTYSDSTPAVTYKYDNLPNAKGALIETSNVVSTSKTTEFDQYGRPVEYQQITDGETYTSKYTYNLSGALVEEEYPTGRKVKNDFDANGDIEKIHNLQTSQSNAKTFADSFKYTPFGGISEMKLGNGKWETAQFNNRLQVTQLGLGNSATDTSLWQVDYEFGELNSNGTVDATKNTGNIAKQTVSFNGLSQPFVQDYKYDELYRLTEAKEQAGSTQNWKQEFGYDRYGNRTSYNKFLGTSAVTLTAKEKPTIQASDNRFSPNQGYTYDKVGNLLSNFEGWQFTFNGDNKQTEVKDSAGNVIGTYSYDGNGKRITKVTDTETTLFVYSGGKKIAEYSTDSAPNADTKYLTEDHLGTPRVISVQSGSVLSRRDFMPFGEDVKDGVGTRASSNKYGIDDKVREGFTGYEKDKETGLDFAEARMYENRHARFTAVDPLLASGRSVNPQTFNRYIYAGNNPITRIDSEGTEWYYKFVKEKEQWVVVPVWIANRFDAGGKGLWGKQARYTENGQVLWKGKADFAHTNIAGKHRALDPYENRWAELPTLEAAQAQVQRWRDQAVINFLGGILEGASFLADIFGGAARIGAESSLADGTASEVFETGRRAGVAGSLVGAVTPVGLTNFVLKRFGRTGLTAFKTYFKLCCFVEGTPIRTKDGLVPIEDIKVGDLVLSYNEETKEFEYKPVAETFTAIKSDIVKIKIEGEKVLTTTTEHPFFVRKKDAAGEWLTAAELKRGYRVLRPDGKWTPITKVSRETKPTKVYNFEVENNHNYFVGEIGVLSHNCDLINSVKKGVNSNLQHAAERAVERAGFSGTLDEAKTALRDLTKQFRTQGLPMGTIVDPDNADRILVPFGDNQYAVYQVLKNGTARLKTVLERR